MNPTPVRYDDHAAQTPHHGHSTQCDPLTRHDAACGGVGGILRRPIATRYSIAAARLRAARGVAGFLVGHYRDSAKVISTPNRNACCTSPLGAKDGCEQKDFGSGSNRETMRTGPAKRPEPIVQHNFDGTSNPLVAAVDNLDGTVCATFAAEITGPVTAFLNNGDGTMTLANLVLRSDGTAVFEAATALDAAGSALVDNADGTVMSTAQVLQIAAAGAGALVGNTLTAAAHNTQHLLNLLFGLSGIGSTCSERSRSKPTAAHSHSPRTFRGPRSTRSSSHPKAARRAPSGSSWKS